MVVSSCDCATSIVLYNVLQPMGIRLEIFTEAKIVPFILIMRKNLVVNIMIVEFCCVVKQKEVTLSW